MSVALESPDQPDVLALIAALDAYQDTLYPPESRHLLDLAGLLMPSVWFAVARDGRGRALGCAAVVRQDADWGELKRMYVHPDARGLGLAGQLLRLLEAKAAQAGCRLLRLETGPRQPEALAFYAAAGFVRRGPYGGYWDDPLSVFMEKRLAPDEAAA